MSNLISVPRELLERALTILALSPSGLYGELRALLAKPAPIPVPAAWMRFDLDQKAIFTRGKRSDDSEPLYPHPTAYRMPKPAAQHQGNAVAARVCAYTPGLGQVELKLSVTLPQWLELGEVVTVLHGAAQHHAAQWPKLDKPALVGAGRFSAGLSARLVVEAAQRHYEYEITSENETLRIATGENFLALLAQLEQLRGLRPALPPRPPEGNGLPRYGLRWNGPQQPLATPMDDGYWTPWHLANEMRKDGERYRWLRSRDLETINQGGVFAGITPQNMVLNEETLDEAVDAAMAKEVQP
ncbi:hypothetical protein [Pseudomonas sp. QD4]|uniref:hypothetical protein n=1 Tax=Pseudomonas sp. QD4 TaxID=3368618 RepID=UPI003BA0DA31